MAIAFRAAGTFDKGNGAITPGLPSGHILNDILLLFVQSSNETISAPSGYAEVTTASPQGTGTAASAGSVKLAVFWKRDNGSESAPSVADTGDHTAGIILAFSGCITTGNPWDVNAGDTGASDTAVTIPAVTTTVANTMIVAAVGHAVDSTSAQGSGEANSNLTNVAERADSSTTFGTGGGFVIITGEKASIGSTGTTADTLANTSKQARITIALKPPAGGVIVASNLDGLSNFQLGNRLG